MPIKINKTHIIGMSVIVAAMIIAMVSFQSSLTNYVSVREAKMSERPVQVAGILVKDSAQYDSMDHRLIFTLHEDSGDEMDVEYNGSRPADLESGSKIVVIGRYHPDKGVFLAKDLLLKCPTKYESRVKGS